MFFNRLWMRGCVTAGLLLMGCEQSTTPDAAPPTRTAVEKSQASSVVAEKTASTAGTPGSSGGLQEFDGMKFQVPADWQQLELSEMQKGIIAAKFGIPAVGDEITLTLSTSGGSIPDNIQRWEGQFSGGPSLVQESLNIDGQDAQLVRLQGTFSPGFGRPAEDGWGMLGVVIPMESFNYYLKLTGPVDQIAKAEEQFLTFCRSARRA